MLFCLSGYGVRVVLSSPDKVPQKTLGDELGSEMGGGGGIQAPFKNKLLNRLKQPMTVYQCKVSCRRWVPNTVLFPQHGLVPRPWLG